MIENVSTQLTVFHCFAHCLLPGRAFASLYALLFLEKEAEIGGREYIKSYSVRARLDLDSIQTEWKFKLRLFTKKTGLIKAVLYLDKVTKDQRKETRS